MIGSWVRVALTVGALACQQANANRAHDLATSPAQRLVGVWDVQFHLDRPLQIVAPPSTRDVRGTVALIENHLGNASFRELPKALNYGVYDVDFKPIGFDPHVVGGVPTAVARATSDSVEMVLSPGSDHMAIVMHGRFTADSVTGAWSVDLRAAGGGGHFVMRRQR